MLLLGKVSHHALCSEAIAEPLQDLDVIRVERRASALHEAVAPLQSKLSARNGCTIVALDVPQVCHECRVRPVSNGAGLNLAAAVAAPTTRRVAAISLAALLLVVRIAWASSGAPASTAAPAAASASAPASSSAASPAGNAPARGVVGAAGGSAAACIAELVNGSCIGPRAAFRTAAGLGRGTAAGSASSPATGSATSPAAPGSATTSPAAGATAAGSAASIAAAFTVGASGRRGGTSPATAAAASPAALARLAAAHIQRCRLRRVHGRRFSNILRDGLHIPLCLLRPCARCRIAWGWC
mmetsp:Transcript_3754/g.11905  ORF Transcript_3754/g.11905 Transcript_3754/m.11905 type:complete len:299 (-) Transcript_3754:395-1291(-)